MSNIMNKVMSKSNLQRWIFYQVDNKKSFAFTASVNDEISLRIHDVKRHKIITEDCIIGVECVNGWSDIDDIIDVFELLPVKI